jgi:hypothetical protein
MKRHPQGILVIELARSITASASSMGSTWPKCSTCRRATISALLAG